jgi:hypothetical protein
MYFHCIFTKCITPGCEVKLVRVGDILELGLSGFNINVFEDMTFCVCVVMYSGESVHPHRVSSKVCLHDHSGNRTGDLNGIRTNALPTEL